MVGSHLMDKPVFNINEEAVEEGHFTTRVRPSQGVRLVYLPCKEDDLEFKICDAYIDTATGLADGLQHNPEDFYQAVN